MRTDLVLTAPTLSSLTATPRSDRTVACADIANPERFFPLNEDGPDAAAAKAVCAGCDVSESCLAWALANAVPAGIWGGLSTTQREALIRAQRQAGRRSSGREQIR